MAVLGMRGTGSFSAEERPKNFRESILREYPNGGATLTMVLGMLKSEAVDDPQFYHFEQGLPDQRFLIDAHNNNTTSITLDGTTTAVKNFKVGHVIRNDRTEEVMLVTGVNPGTGVLTVVRGIGTATVGVTGVAGLDTDYISIIGSSHEEGVDTPTAISWDPTSYYNYIQTFRTSMTLTDDAAQTYYRTGNILETKKFDTALAHAIEMEKAFLFGKREMVTGGIGSQPQRMTGGLSYWVNTLASSNVVDFSSTGLTKTGLNNWLRPIYTVPGGSTNKLAMCGARAMGALNDYAEAHAHMNVEPRGETYGLQIKTLYHAWGELKLVNHPLLSEHSEWTKMIFVVDTRNIKYRFLRNRDTRFLKDRQGNGEDRVTHEFMTKCGLELQHARTHGIATGISEFIA